MNPFPHNLISSTELSREIIVINVVEIDIIGSCIISSEAVA
ncbi:MAG: hypothetical protein ACKVH8_06015 [Pirellulales bacterium]